MELLILADILQVFLVLLLIAKDKNDGEKELFKTQQWKFSDVAIVMSLIIAYPYFFRLLLDLHSIRPFFVPIFLYLHHLVFLLLIIALLVRAKQGPGILGFKKFNLRAVALGIFISLVITAPVFFVHPAQPNKYITVYGILKGFEKPLFLVFVIIAGPIIEESLYRGILYSPYRKKYGPTKAIIINIILSYMGHYILGGHSNPLAGLVFCLLYEKTESIYPSIAAHSINNLFALRLIA